MKTILLTLIAMSSYLFGNIKVDQKIMDETEYVQFLKDYKNSFRSGNLDINSIQKIIKGYIYLGDRYYNLQGYKRAKKYYLEAYKFHSELAKRKLSIVYEKEAELYIKGKRYKKAYYSYKEAKRLGNNTVNNKLKVTLKKIKHLDNLYNDTRQIVSQSAPVWTQAIGKLVVPISKKLHNGKLYKQSQKCSATLVNFNDSATSKVIVTASHCISDFDKKAGAIKFFIKSKNGKLVQKFADIYMDSIYDENRIKINSDYAVLILSSGIAKNDITPLLVPNKSFEDMKSEYAFSFASLGGYSSDVGSNGTQLSYDPKCQIQKYSNTYAKSTCKGYKGASGGAVVFNGSYDRKNYDNYFVGVVSHFKNGKYDQIYFSPHHIFYKYLQSAIEQYNY